MGILLGSLESIMFILRLLVHLPNLPGLDFAIATTNVAIFVI